MEKKLLELLKETCGDDFVRKECYHTICHLLEKIDELENKLKESENENNES